MTFVSRFIIFMVMILFFSGVAQAGNIIVEPTEYTVDLIGGDVITRPITITWTGETAVVGFIETSIAPDGEGINVTYSEDPVVLYPNVPNTVDMTITTAINLIPGIYVITTLVFTEIEKVIEYRSRGGGTTTIYKTIEIENITYINILLEIIQQLKDEINATKGNCTDQILLLTDIIDILDGMIEDLQQQQPQTGLVRAEEYNWWIPFIVFLAVLSFLLIIALGYLGHKFRVLKSQIQRAKEEKEPEKKEEKEAKENENEIVK